MDSVAIADMLESGLLQRVGAGGLEAFLAGDGLRVLFFAGGAARRPDAHDVAVALREILREYGGSIRAALVEEADEAALQPRFRVLVTPSLVLLLAGATLEVIPRVRDWSDYTAAFRRYLGSPRARAATETH